MTLHKVYVDEVAGIWIEEDREYCQGRLIFNVGGDTDAELNKEQVKELLKAITNWLTESPSPP